MLYAIVDPDHAPGGDVLRLAAQCLDGGADFLQLRAKRWDDARVLEVARALAQLCQGRAQFVVNDRADLAALSGASGVHVGQEDLPPAAVRRALRPGQRLGISTHDAAQVRAAVAAGADLLGFGPVFPSGSKSGHAAVTGVEGLREAVALAQGIPVVAIGGVTGENAGLCAAAGASAVAVIGALAHAPDPSHAARALRDAFQRGVPRR